MKPVYNISKDPILKRYETFISLQGKYSLVRMPWWRRWLRCFYRCPQCGGKMKFHDWMYGWSYKCGWCNWSVFFE